MSMKSGRWATDIQTDKQDKKTDRRRDRQPSMTLYRDTQTGMQCDKYGFVSAILSIRVADLGSLSRI
jgi:hypothetical protein